MSTGSGGTSSTSIYRLSFIIIIFSANINFTTNQFERFLKPSCSSVNNSPEALEGASDFIKYQVQVTTANNNNTQTWRTPSLFNPIDFKKRSDWTRAKHWIHVSARTEFSAHTSGLVYTKNLSAIPTCNRGFFHTFFRIIPKISVFVLLKSSCFFFFKVYFVFQITSNHYKGTQTTFQFWLMIQQLVEYTWVTTSLLY